MNKKVVLEVSVKRIILAALLIITIVYVVGFLNGYRTINNNYFLKRKIRETISEFDDKEYDSNSLKIRNKVKIDNKLIVYYTFNTINDEEGSGWLMLEKGYNLNYDMESIVFGVFTEWPADNSMMNKVIFTNEGKYLLIMGQNTDDHSEIQFYFEDYNYQRNLPRDEYFIIHVKVPQYSDPKSSPKDISYR